MHNMNGNALNILLDELLSQITDKIYIILFNSKLNSLDGCFECGVASQFVFSNNIKVFITADRLSVSIEVINEIW